MTKRSTLEGWLATFMFLSLTGLAVAGEKASVLPGSCDLRPSFAGAELPLRLQGGRGTCSVFTMVGGLEYALAQQRGKSPRLSVEYLNWASNEATQDKEDGSFFSDLWTGFAAYGICTEPGMPTRKSSMQHDGQAWRPWPRRVGSPTAVCGCIGLSLGTWKPA